MVQFQRQQPASEGTVRSTRPENCCQHITPYRFIDGFPDPSQFSTGKPTHYSSKPQQPSDSSRPRQRLLLSGDVHPHPGPTTKSTYLGCARNVTSRGVSYLYNRCSVWVHSKCSGLQNAAEYSSRSSPLPTQHTLPPSIPIHAVDGNPFTIMQFNANSIGNTLTELGELLERHNVNVAVIGNQSSPQILEFQSYRTLQ